MKRLLRILIRSLALSVFLVAAAGVGLYYYKMGPRWVSTENAYIKTQMIAVSADVDGRVSQVLVANNDFVEEGALLFQLEQEPFQIAVASADAELGKIEQRIQSYKDHYRLAQLQIREAQEGVRFYQVQYERHKNLNGTGARALLDEAEHELEMAKINVDVIQQRNAMALTDLAGDPNLPSAKHPLYLKAKAMRDQSARDLKKTTIFAPTAGYLSNVNLEPGEYVEAGEPVFSLVVGGQPWLEANLKESQLTYVQVGQKATVELDAYPDWIWDATVASISRATGAEFALLPPQNATGNWVKVVQRIPVRLEVVPNEEAPPLRAGMTVSVRIDTKQERELYALLEAVLGAASAIGLGSNSQ